MFEKDIEFFSALLSGEVEINSEGEVVEKEKVDPETEAENAGILNRAELEPALQAIAAETNYDNQNSQILAFMNAVEQHSGCQWGTFLHAKDGRAYPMPSWIWNLYNQMHLPKPINVVEQHEVGEVVEQDGAQWLVTSCYYDDGKTPILDDENIVEGYPERGWHSRLWPLTDVTRVIAEQYADGQARFTSGDSVLFADEQYAHRIYDLAYSSELGLYNRKQVKP